ncbi:MAG: SLC13 family permease [Lentisphaeraceae bacterium]|nr:SLC13 family permease [Lentisphaeraceae bacterium]
MNFKQAGPALALIAGIVLIILLKVSVINQASFCLGAMILMIVCLFTETYTPALSLTSAVALIVTGSKVFAAGDEKIEFLKLEEAFNGFSNPAVFTIGSLFVVAAAIKNTGIINLLAAKLLSKAASVRSAILKMAAPLVGMSAIFNNTPIVAIFIPSVREWAINNKISPSKLLIPLAYMTTFGGLFTIIGTSTNIMINEMLGKDGYDKFSIFEFALVAFPAAILGVTYLATLGVKLLPERKDLLQEDLEGVKRYLVEMAVEPKSPLLGKTIAESGLKEMPNLFLFGILREGKLKTPIQDKAIFRDGDRLVFTGESAHLEHLDKIDGLSNPTFCNSPEICENAQIVEAIIPTTSSLIGKTLEDVWFNQRYDATVIALHRNGEDIISSLSKTPLKAGDTMLLVTGTDYSEVWKTSQDFYFVSGIERQQIPSISVSTILTLITAALMIIIPAFTNTIGIEYTSILAAIIITVIKKSRNIFMQVDWNVLVVIGAAFGIKTAFVNSGANIIVSDIITSVSAGGGKIAVLIILYIITNILTEMITNSAAAALVFPIAISAATTLGVSPIPFVAAIAFAASASFATPIGYQTNMMVYGPGGYKYIDYLKVGLPLNIIYGITTVCLAQLVWQF